MSDKPFPRNWDERYATDEFLFGTEPNDFLKAESAALTPRGKVLCLADGEGRNGVYLAGLGHEVTSIDQSVRGLEKAQLLASERQVSISTIQADLTDHDLGEGKWDAIVSIFFHMPPELREAIYPRIVRALKPGGVLLLESYIPRQLAFGTGGPPVADMMMTEAIALEFFGDLDIERLEELERTVVEGPGHTGQAAVLQLIARRPVS